MDANAQRLDLGLRRRDLRSPVPIHVNTITAIVYDNGCIIIIAVTMIANITNTGPLNTHRSTDPTYTTPSS